ncbi:MAG TPA: cytochrome c [Chthonomonadaceae bacterium]|nr:cytochrome c [Chthonomonadaceae bacterium]
MLLGKSKQAVGMAASFAFLMASLWIAGCAKQGESGGSAPAAQGDASLVDAGKAVYASNGCARCHSLGGQGGRMGPDLTRVGADTAHTPQWLIEHIKNPKTHNPASRMPAFEGRINDKDLNALGAYLASLK